MGVGAYLTGKALKAEVRREREGKRFVERAKKKRRAVSLNYELNPYNWEGGGVKQKGLGTQIG